MSYPFVIAYGLVKRHRGVLLCVLWIMIPMLPASNLFMKVGTLLAERLLYVPSLGYCCLVAFGIRRLFLDTEQTIHRVVCAWCDRARDDDESDSASYGRLVSLHRSLTSLKKNTRTSAGTTTSLCLNLQ